MTTKENQLKYGEIIAKCWEDAEFKKSFITDPEAVLKEAGVEIKEGIDYKVIEAPKLVTYIVLPSEDVKDAVTNLSKGLLQAAENKNVIVPEGVELRIIQNTEDTKYLVLPASPKTLTESELSLIAGGESVYNTMDIAIMQTEAVVTSTTVNLEAEASVAVVAVAGAVVAGAVVLI